jgi:hypothetical protein
MGEMRNAYRILVGNPERKISLRRPRHKMDLRELGFEHVDSIRLAQDGGRWWAVVNTAVYRQFP